MILQRNRNINFLDLKRERESQLLLLLLLTRICIYLLCFSQGISINTYDLQNVTYPLIYGGDAANISGGFTDSSSR